MSNTDITEINEVLEGIPTHVSSGTSFFSSGYIFAPYMPLIVSANPRSILEDLVSVQPTDPYYIPMTITTITISGPREIPENEKILVPDEEEI